MLNPVDAGEPRPALLLEWRRDEHGGWEGRVVYVAELRFCRWALVDEWVTADFLSDSAPGSQGQ